MSGHPLGRSPGWRRRTVVAALWGAGAGLVLVYLQALRLGTVQNVLVVVAGTVIVAGLGWLTADLHPGATPAYWFDDRLPARPPRRGNDFRLHTLRRDLRYTLDEPQEPDAIRDLLVALTVDRVRDRHGVDLGAEPERAREVLDPVLVEYLSGPLSPRRRRSRSHLSTLLDRIEAL